MTRYLISFPDGAMNFPQADLPDVAKAAHDVVADAKAAGVWVTGGGVDGHLVSIVGTDGTVNERETRGHLGGFSIVEVASRAEALAWAAKFAIACRCAQEVRALGDDPDV